MSSQTPAQVRRAELIADQSRTLVRVLDGHDVQQLELARVIARAADKVQRVCDADCKETASIVDVRLALEDGGRLEEVALDLVRWQLGDRYAIARVPSHETVADDLRHLARLMEEAGALAAHVAGAVADSRISADEAAIGLDHCSTLITTLAALRERLQHALARRGDTVRRVAGG